MLVGGDELAHLHRIADDDLGPAVPDAVVEVGRRDPVRERDETGAEPLATPVQLDRLRLVGENARDPGSWRNAARSEPVGDPRRANPQLGVRQPRRFADERLRVGGPLCRVKEAECEVHAPATSAIASTIGV